MMRLRITLGVAVMLMALGPACARPAVVKAETYACVNWAGAHEYTLASLRPKGARANKYCPLRFSVGTKVEIIQEDDDGYAVVQVGGKTWWVDGDRLK